MHLGYHWQNYYRNQPTFAQISLCWFRVGLLGFPIRIENSSWTWFMLGACGSNRSKPGWNAMEFGALSGTPTAPRIPLHLPGRWL